MTDPESRSGPAGADLAAALIAAGVGLGPVEPRRRLVHDGQDRVLEFYSATVGGRLLAMHQHAFDHAAHESLSAQGLPVLSRLSHVPEGFVFLHIPLGTYPLRSRLHLIRREIGLYASLFTDMIVSQRRQYEAGLGVTVAGESSLLDHFALVEGGDSLTGLSPYLIPPYDNDPAGTPEDFTNQLLGELAHSAMLDGDQIEYLRTVAIQGVIGGESA